MVINIVGGACSINYYDGQGIYIYNSDYTYDADVGIGTYQGGSFEVYGDENLYLRKGSYTYSLPNKSGALKLGNDESIRVDNGSSYEYDLSDYTRAIITLSSFDDDGHADLTIEDDGTNSSHNFHAEMDLTNFWTMILEIFKNYNYYLVRCTYEGPNTSGHSEIKQTIGSTASSLIFKYEGVSSSNKCIFRVEAF